MLWKGIWVPSYVVAPVQVGGEFLENWGRSEPEWCCNVMVEAMDCIPHPYHMYAECFSTLICCEWAYGSTLTLLCLCRSGVVDFWIIGVWLSPSSVGFGRGSGERVLPENPVAEARGPAQDFPKFQMPCLTPKSVQTCSIYSPDGDRKVSLKKIDIFMTNGCPIVTLLEVTSDWLMTDSWLAAYWVLVHILCSQSHQ